MKKKIFNLKLLCLVVWLALTFNAKAQMTPYQAVEKMTCGINIGQTLELEYEPTRKIQEYYFTDFVNAGFDFVRIPIRWDKHTGATAPYTIDPAWLTRVEQVVDWSLAHGLITIINTHHDDWILANNNPTANDIARFKAIWTQVADRFKNKSEKLLFEIANEPNIAINLCDNLNAYAIPIIRQTNPTRNIVFGSSGTQMSTLKQAVIPSDPYLIASIHSYIPWPFAGEAIGTWGSAAEITQIQGIMAEAAAWVEAHNIPILLGEFSARVECEVNARTKWFTTHLQEARRQNLAPCVWMDFGWFTLYYDTQIEANKWTTAAKNAIVAKYHEPAEALAISNSFQLTWNNRDADYQSITIERKTGTGAYQSIATLAGSAETYLDATAIAGTNYTYRIVSKFSTGLNGYSFPSKVGEGVIVDPVPVNLPALIQAENYTTMYGIQTEGTTDAGGGADVGWTEAGDYMDYYVNVPSTGVYAVDFRVASQVTTGKIELRNQAGKALATLTQGTTGGWQVWATKTVNANLTAGTQTLRIYYTGAGLNLNWFEVKQSQVLTTITVTPATASITSGQTQQLTAVGKDQNGNVMTIAPTWTTTGGGTISSSGLYTATTAGGSFTVTAAVGTVSGSAQVTVAPLVLTTITVTPATATIVAGQTQQYTAVGKDQLGNVMAIAPVWATTGGGSINASGLYTSTTGGGPFTVSASVGAVSGTAQVTVTPAPVLTTITVSPATATITVGQTQQFTAVGKDQFGVVMTIAPTWAATGGGTVSASGLFTAVTAGGPFTVSASVGVISGAAQVIVNPAPVSQTIQAESYTTMFGVQTETTADAGGGANVGWIAAGDWMTYSVTIPQTGTYSAKFRVSGWTATGTFALQNAANTTLTNVTVPNGGTGAYQVWSTVSGNNTFQLTAGTQNIRIYATGPSWNLNWFELKLEASSVLTTIIVSPSPVSVTSGSSQQFTAVGKDQYGNVMAITPTWTATGGTISTSGLFTAGAATGNNTVIATSGLISNSAQVTITSAPVLTTITVTPTGTSINVGQTAQFTAVGKDQNGNIMSIAPIWSATGGSITTSGLYTGTTVGNQTVTATSGSVFGVAGITVNAVQSGLAIPGKIEAEAYTTMFGIQTEACTDAGGGTNIGYVDAGDWLNYGVNVAIAGTYMVSFRVASQVTTGALQVKNGATVLATVTIPNTAGWQNWQTITANVTLSQGAQTLQILATGTGLNLNYMDFAIAPNFIKIEAESYTTMFGIQTEATTDAGGGLDVGYTDAGDYMDYLVTIPTTGLYTVEFRVASLYATGKIELKNQTGTTLATLTQGSTGGWQNWLTKSITANLTAGAQTLRIYYLGDDLNLNWFMITEGLKDAEGISEQISKVKMYPNPVSQFVLIELGNTKYSNLEILTLSGRKILSQEIAGQESVELDLTPLEKGIYIITLKGLGIMHNEKLIVK
jgi:hypothetical protein